MSLRQARRTRDGETGKTMTVRLVGVDGFDVAPWEAAGTTHPERVSWARMTSQRQQKNGDYIVTMEIDRKTFDAISGSGQEAMKLSERVRLWLSEIAHKTVEENHFRTEVMGLPHADDGEHGPDDGVAVEWPLGDAAWVVQSVQWSTGEVGQIRVRRIDVGSESARLLVHLPEGLEANLETETAGEGDNPSKRIWLCIERAIDAEQTARLRTLSEADDTDIPF